jgi:hypothetical protein
LSYDLAVFGSELPDLADAVNSEGSAVTVEGALEAVRASVSLIRQQRHGVEHVCEIDGPLEADDADAPEDVAAALLMCRWTVQISCPSDLTKVGFKVVERVARRLADSGTGVVYDPQLDKIVWPRTPRTLRELPRRRNADVARVEIQWLVARRLDARDGHALLQTLRRICPEAVPKRFGDYEPMQGHLERDGDAAFATMWNGSAMLFWRGQFPCDHGFVSLSRGWGSALSRAEREARTPILGGRKAVQVDSVSLQFWTDVVDDHRWLALLKRVFVTITGQLGCFFAAGYCSPDTHREAVRLTGRYWLGIPDADLWLVWVGAPYTSDLPLGVTSDGNFDTGAVLQLGSSPVAWKELRENKIAWPDQMLRRGDHLDESSAADVIPDLGDGRGPIDMA